MARTVALFGDGMISVALAAGCWAPAVPRPPSGSRRPPGWARWRSAEAVGAPEVLLAGAVINMLAVAALLGARPIRRLERIG